MKPDEIHDILFSIHQKHNYFRDKRILNWLAHPVFMFDFTDGHKGVYELHIRLKYFHSDMSYNGYDLRMYPRITNFEKSFSGHLVEFRPTGLHHKNQQIIIEYRKHTGVDLFPRNLLITNITHLNNINENSYEEISKRIESLITQLRVEDNIRNVCNGYIPYHTNLFDAVS